MFLHAADNTGIRDSGLLAIAEALPHLSALQYLELNGDYFILFLFLFDLVRRHFSLFVSLSPSALPYDCLIILCCCYIVVMIIDVCIVFSTMVFSI